MMIEYILVVLAFLVATRETVIRLFERQRRMGILRHAPLALLAACLALRVAVTGRAPFTSLFESLIFFCLLYLAKVRLLPGPSRRTRGWLLVPLLMALLAALALPDQMRAVHGVPPALRSPWLFIHVPLCLLGYVSLAAAGMLSAVDLARKSDLDQSIRTEARLAFFFLTAGLIAGGFWAGQSWGAFWSWEHKQSWSLVTWLLLLSHFFCPGLTARRATLLLALAAMLFTYLGVSLLMPGPHAFN